MLNFLKTCGIGVIVIISSPLWLAFFAVYVALGTLLYILSPFRLLIALLTHKNYTIKTAYDEKAAAILKGQQNTPLNVIPAPQYQQHQQPMNTNYFNNQPMNNNYNPNQNNGNYYPPQGNNQYPQNPQNSQNYNQNNYPNNNQYNNPNNGGNQR